MGHFSVEINTPFCHCDNRPRRRSPVDPSRSPRTWPVDLSDRPWGQRHWTEGGCTGM